MLVTGVGGTGVVTVGALITMAAHLEGKQASVLDFMGFAQKGGAVLSFVRVAPTADQLNQVRIDTQQADVLLACDMVVGASDDALATVKHGAHRDPRQHPRDRHRRLRAQPRRDDARARADRQAAPRGRRRARAAGRRAGAGAGADGRHDAVQHHHAGRVLAARPGAGVVRRADARDRAEQRGRREQQDRVRDRPPGGHRSDGVPAHHGRRPAARGSVGATVAVRARAASSSAASSSSPRTRTPRWPRASARWSRRCMRANRRWAMRARR